MTIQLVPEPESSKVLTLKGIPDSVCSGIMSVGEMDIQSSVPEFI